MKISAEVWANLSRIARFKAKPVENGNGWWVIGATYCIRGARHVHFNPSVDWSKQ